MKIIVFDTETSGLPSVKEATPYTINYWPYVLQFSYIVYDINSHKLVKTFDSLVKIKEDVVISKKSFEIHGITKEQCLKEGKPINNIIHEFMIDLNECQTIIGHNIDFDKNMLIIEMIRNNLFELFVPILNKKSQFCTMKKTVNLCNIELEGNHGIYKKYPKLNELHEKLFYFTPKFLHNSFHDILITLRCYVKIKTNIDVVLVDNNLNRLIKPLVN